MTSKPVVKYLILEEAQSFQRLEGGNAAGDQEASARKWLKMQFAMVAPNYGAASLTKFSNKLCSKWNARASEQYSPRKS